MSLEFEWDARRKGMSYRGRVLVVVHTGRGCISASSAGQRASRILAHSRRSVDNARP